jgi:hypothetical protein
MEKAAACAGVSITNQGTSTAATSSVPGLLMGTRCTCTAGAPSSMNARASRMTGLWSTSIAHTGMYMYRQAVVVIAAAVVGGLKPEAASAQLAAPRLDSAVVLMRQSPCPRRTCMERRLVLTRVRHAADLDSVAKNADQMQLSSFPRDISQGPEWCARQTAQNGTVEVFLFWADNRRIVRDRSACVASPSFEARLSAFRRFYRDVAARSSRSDPAE